MDSSKDLSSDFMTERSCTDKKISVTFSKDYSIFYSMVRDQSIFPRAWFIPSSYKSSSYQPYSSQREWHEQTITNMATLTANKTTKMMHIFEYKNHNCSTTTLKRTGIKLLFIGKAPKNMPQKPALRGDVSIPPESPEICTGLIPLKFVPCW